MHALRLKLRDLLLTTAIIFRLMWQHTGWEESTSHMLLLSVVQFLAQKQAASIRAREAARSATQQLHTFLQDAGAELGVSRSAKRQRV